MEFLRHREPSCSSTNDLAFERMQGTPIAVWTSRQSGGRGSRGRAWHSPTDCGLALSLGFEDDMHDRPYSMMAGLTVLDVLHNAGLEISDLRLKWPNDVLLKGAKVAGILCETRWRGNRARKVLGIGVNVRRHPAFSTIGQPVTTLEDAGLTVTFDGLADRLIAAFQEVLSQGVDNERMVERWTTYSWISLNRMVSVTTDSEVWVARFRGIDPCGRALVEREGGRIQRIDQHDVRISEFDHHEDQP